VPQRALWLAEHIHCLQAGDIFSGSKAADLEMLLVVAAAPGKANTALQRTVLEGLLVWEDSTAVAEQRALASAFC
jgi:hypothetical protein